MAGHTHRADANRFDHAGGPSHILWQAGTIGQGAAFAMTGHVHGKNMRLKPHLRPPSLGPQADAMDQKERFARPSFQHPDGAAVRQPQGS